MKWPWSRPTRAEAAAEDARELYEAARRRQAEAAEVMEESRRLRHENGFMANVRIAMEGRSER